MEELENYTQPEENQLTDASSELPRPEIDSTDTPSPMSSPTYEPEDNPAPADIPAQPTTQPTVDDSPQSTQEETDYSTPSYNANIPGPTKYDQAYRTYRDALERGQTAGAVSVGNRQPLAIASLVLGIVSCLLLFIPIFGWMIGLCTSVTGIVLGALGLKSTKRALSLAGLIISIIALALLLILLVVTITMIVIYALQSVGDYSPYYYNVPRSYSGSPYDIFPYMK